MGQKRQKKGRKERGSKEKKERVRVLSCPRLVISNDELISQLSHKDYTDPLPAPPPCQKICTVANPDLLEHRARYRIPANYPLWASYSVLIS